MAFSRWAAPMFGAIAVVLAAVGLWLGFTAPEDYQQGETVRIMFIHVPAAGCACSSTPAWAGELPGAGVPPRPGRRRRPGRRAAGRGLHLPGAGHRLALGPADVGHLVGVGRAADLGAGAVPALPRLHGPAGLDRRRGQGRPRRRDPGPGGLDQPADHPLLRGLVEHPAPGRLAVPRRRRPGHAAGLLGPAAAHGAGLHVGLRRRCGWCGSAARSGAGAPRPRPCGRRGRDADVRRRQVRRLHLARPSPSPPLVFAGHDRLLAGHARRWKRRYEELRQGAGRK